MNELSPVARATSTTARRRSKVDQLFEELLASVDVRVGGERPWDITIHHPDTAARVFSDGSLGMGESYMDGWWDSPRIDELLLRILQGHLDDRVGKARVIALHLLDRLVNRQSPQRAWQVGRAHYDLDHRIFEAMLDDRLNYSCGYWARATTLDQAQTDKLELTCRKLGLRAGMRLLDIGCGWGSLMGYAAEHFGVTCVGITISTEQAQYVRQRYAHLPVEVHLQDYRTFNDSGSLRFDRIASIGMFEHVGHKNYRDFFSMALRSLDGTGLMLLHTIGRRRSDTAPDPWIDRYVFPNHELPSLAQITAACEGRFLIEDLENFGADYDRTLMSWHARLEAAWPALSGQHDERFRRMMRFYLLACAASFRARIDQLWQIVLSPSGVAGGYRRPLLSGSLRQTAD